jgi:hypothetical protein
MTDHSFCGAKHDFDDPIKCCDDDDLLGALSECSQLDSSILDLPACDSNDIVHLDGGGDRDAPRRALLDQSKISASFHRLAKGLPRKQKKVLLQKGRRLERRVATDKLKSDTQRSSFVETPHSSHESGKLFPLLAQTVESRI